MENKWNELQTALTQMKYLTLGQNPVVQNIKKYKMSPEQGREVIRQYFYLVTTIVQFLTIAMVRIPVESVKKELRRNLGEELGSGTNGTSHQELFEKFLQNELKITSRTCWSHSTQMFITGLLLDFNTQTPRFIAGMIYALEATACPELMMIAEIINAAARKEIVKISALTDQTEVARIKSSGANTLQDFLALHTLDFEVGHESGLRTTLDSFASKDWEEFENGFFQVLSAMETWWRGLSKY